MNREQLVAYLLERPNAMFDTVSIFEGEYEDGSPYWEQSTILELAFRNRTLSERVLCDLAREVDLDWYRISVIIPLSVKLLGVCFADVDWWSVSRRLRGKEEDFDLILLFSKNIRWESVCQLSLPSNQVEFLVFVEEAIPLGFALERNLLTEAHVRQYMDRIIDEAFPEFCKSYKAGFIDSIVTMPRYEDALCANADTYVNRCIKDGYVPCNYVEPLFHSTSIGSGDWCLFLVECQPNESFVRNNVLCASRIGIRPSDETRAVLSGKATKGIPGPYNMVQYDTYKVDFSQEFIEAHSDTLVWEYLMRRYTFDIDTIRLHIHEVSPETICRYQRLTPEFIDAFAHHMDWYYLCENHDLPSWLMERHADKLNWRQVWLHQTMSEDFKDKYRDKLMAFGHQLHPRTRAPLHHTQCVRRGGS
jgi:hypothetical protein